MAKDTPELRDHMKRLGDDLDDIMQRIREGVAIMAYEAAVAFEALGKAMREAEIQAKEEQRARRWGV